VASGDIEHQDAGYVRRWMEGTAVGRFGTPDEIGGMVLLLCCERAPAFLTGANVVVDGGYSALS
jgi:NAD(P)-dependent dehydrogenase (short-subunit alcohol dehydrogenase family)